MGSAASGTAVQAEVGTAGIQEEAPQDGGIAGAVGQDTCYSL